MLITSPALDGRSAGVLFLRPKIAGSLRRGIPNRTMLAELFGAYQERNSVGIRGGDTTIEAPPAELRREIFDRARERAARHGIERAICAFKNADLATGRCNISGIWPTGPRQKQISMPI